MNVTTGAQKIIAAKNREYRANKNSDLILKINNFHPFQSNRRINASKLKNTIVPPKINLTRPLVGCFCTHEFTVRLPSSLLTGCGVVVKESGVLFVAIM